MRMREKHAQCQVWLSYISPFLPDDSPGKKGETIEDPTQALPPMRASAA